MNFHRFLFPFTMSLVAMSAQADAPNVVTDFGPTNAIVSRVMQGVGTSTQLLSGADTPHHFALRPSHAQMLSDADIVVWVGPALTPWLSDPLETLAPGAVTLELLDTEGWEALPARSTHDHGVPHRDHDEADDHHDHDDGDEAIDPHAWLDPDIAAIWALAISEALSQADPANASLYQTNANQFWADMALLGPALEAQLAEIDGSRIILPHDSTQYLETRFGLVPAGFVSITDASDPGPAHLRDLRAKVTAGDITCVLGDLETNPGTIDLLREGTETKTGTLNLTDIAGLGYVTMMESIANTLSECTS